MNYLTESRIRAAGVLGTAILLLALLLYFYDGELSSRVFALIVAGLIGLSVWVVFAPQDLRGWLSGRQVASGSTSLILLILFIAATTTIYVAVDRQNITMDFTAETRFTLNDASLQAIARAQQQGRPLRLVGFYARQYLRQREAADIVLRQFDAQGGRIIELQYIDPDDAPLLARQYAYQALEDRSNPIYISYVNDDGSIDASSIRYIGAANERAITQALQNLVTVSGSKFYFTTGHNEISITSQAGTGLSRAAGVLETFGIVPTEINLLTDDIPADARALVIAGPATEFQQAEVDKIADYVAQNGRLLVMANPPYVDSTFGGQSTPVMGDGPLGRYLWDEFGLRLQEDLVVDFGSSFDTEFNPIPAILNSAHEMLVGFGNTSIVFSLARSIEIPFAEDITPRQSLYNQEVLFLTSENSYGETTLQVLEANNVTEYNAETDHDGPLILAATARGIAEINQELAPRVAIVGDIDWLTNDFVVELPGNAELWGVLVQWLSSDAEMPFYEARVASSTVYPIIATDQQRQRVSILTTLGLPLAVLAVGGGVWFWRRR